MDLKHLKELHAARPFRPFTMHHADGRSRAVPHPELMAFLGNGRTVFWSDAHSDGFELIDLILIIAVEVGASESRNGRRRRAG